MGSLRGLVEGRRRPRGKVFTPRSIADLMVEKLFDGKIPRPEDRVLDPGCGKGVFIDSILNWCSAHGVRAPRIVGVELDGELVNYCLNKFRGSASIVHADFLRGEFGKFDFIICNPPYARLEELDEEERGLYKKLFRTAVGRFDLYMLFFEKAIESLKEGGRLVFITPEKFEYTLSAATLRKLISKHYIKELYHLKEDAFSRLITYPTITVIDRVRADNAPTKIVTRDGLSFTERLPNNGSRWISVIKRSPRLRSQGLTLKDIARRISCGVATGRDEVFVIPRGQVPKELLRIAYPAVSGRDLTSNGIKVRNMMIIPYDRDGHLLQEDELKDFIEWTSKDDSKLRERYCVRKGKREWYEFHEIPPMRDILRPKILCKDVSEEPSFWVDESGTLIPRHSTYYIVPRNPLILHELHEYLNSEEVGKWLIANAQRAANNFIRLQSSVLKELPVPHELAKGGFKRIHDF